MARFDVTGPRNMNQSNGFTVGVNIFHVRPDGVFVGTASHSNGAVQGAGFGGVGVVSPNEFTFHITWSNGTRGFYSGAFDGSGVIKGVTFDEAHPESTATWQSSKAFARH